MTMRQGIEGHNFARLPLQIDEQIDPQANQAIPVGIRAAIAHKPRVFALPLTGSHHSYRIRHGGMRIFADHAEFGSFGCEVEEFLG